MKRIFATLDWAAATVFSVVMVLAVLYSVFGSSWKEKSTVAKQAAEAAPRHKDLLLMDKVRTVNSEVSTLMLSPFFSLSMDEPAPCMLAKNVNGRADRNNPIVVKIAANYKRECDFTQFSRNLTLPVFENIAATRSLPPKMVAFEVFHENQWGVVGLFVSDESCKSAREEASRQGFGTKACGNWQANYE